MFALFLLFAFIFAFDVPAQKTEDKPGNKVPFVKPPEKDYYKKSQQMVLVTTKDWNAVQGKLQRYERSSGKNWKAVGGEFAVVIGKNGMAWGTGLHEPSKKEPIKREGDGKSPAGVFVLSSVFGFAPKEEAAFLKLPYTHVTESTECVDDVKSNHYNRVVDK